MEFNVETTKPNTLKFENEFDFEQGNNKFEEIRSQLSKLKVGEEAKTEQVVNQNQVKFYSKMIFFTFHAYPFSMDRW